MDLLQTIYGSSDLLVVLETFSNAADVAYLKQYISNQRTILEEIRLAMQSDARFPGLPELFDSALEKLSRLEVLVSRGARGKLIDKVSCVLPPDSDIFVSIRAGRIERVKTLLVEGRGSIHDVAAPYGLSPLSLALSYGEMDICDLLLSSGAKGCSLVNPDPSGRIISNFWDGFSSREHSMSTAEILQNDIRQIACDMDVRLFDRAYSCAGMGYQSYPRLHKCILGVTLENLGTVLLEVSDTNEPDWLDRTALHLAAYKSDCDATLTLLESGANPRLVDSAGRTPLHISVALGSVECTEPLAVDGENLQAGKHSITLATVLCITLVSLGISKSSKLSSPTGLMSTRRTILKERL